MTSPDFDSLVEFARQQIAGDPDVLSTGRSEADDLLVYVLQEGTCQKLVELDMEKHSPRPFTIRGTDVVHTPASFVHLVNRHRNTLTTTIWADKTSGSFVAVFDDHELRNSDSGDTTGGDTRFPQAGWGEHRAQLTLTVTPEWHDWLTGDGQFYDQATFAQHLEQRAVDIVDPDPATFYEVASSLVAKRGVEFKSTIVDASGDVHFHYEETTQASAGKKGQLEIPRTFHIAIAPWDGVARAEIEARLLYRVTGSGLALGYRLIRPRDVLTQVFETLTAGIEDGIGLPVYAGIPHGTLR